MEVTKQFLAIELITRDRNHHTPIVPVKSFAHTTEEDRVGGRKLTLDLQRIRGHMTRRMCGRRFGRRCGRRLKRARAARRNALKTTVATVGFPTSTRAVTRIGLRVVCHREARVYRGKPAPSARASDRTLAIYVLARFFTDS